MSSPDVGGGGVNTLHDLGRGLPARRGPATSEVPSFGLDRDHVAGGPHPAPKANREEPDVGPDVDRGRALGDETPAIRLPARPRPTAYRRGTATRTAPRPRAIKARPSSPPTRTGRSGRRRGRCLIDPVQAQFVHVLPRWARAQDHGTAAGRRSIRQPATHARRNSGPSRLHVHLGLTRYAFVIVDRDLLDPELLTRCAEQEVKVSPPITPR